VILAALLLTVAGVPVVERPATTPKNSDRFAVMITGDGGWKKIDERVTRVLRAEGVPVVGFVSSEYFREERTPEQAASALEQVIRAYQKKWQKPNVILIGYSRGADALPFMASRLPADLRDATKLVALLGLESWIDFKYNPPWTLGHYVEHPKRFDVLPETQKLRGMNVLCVYGEKEKDSLCPSLDPASFTIVRERGGHHFAGRYDEVGRAIVNASAR
jgi:type IV secretory pathway VirJ component